MNDAIRKALKKLEDIADTDVGASRSLAILNCVGILRSALDAPADAQPAPGMVETVARALARFQIDQNLRFDKEPRDAGFLQRAEDAGWKYYTEQAGFVLSRLTAPAGDGWRTMESAPKDGTIVVIAFGEDYSGPGFYDAENDDGFPWRFLDKQTGPASHFINGARQDCVSRWQPLPAAPSPGAKP